MLRNPTKPLGFELGEEENAALADEVRDLVDQMDDEVGYMLGRGLSPEVAEAEMREGWSLTQNQVNCLRYLDKFYQADPTDDMPSLTDPNAFWLEIYEAWQTVRRVEIESWRENAGETYGFEDLEMVSKTGLALWLVNEAIDAIAAHFNYWDRKEDKHSA